MLVLQLLCVISVAQDVTWAWQDRYPPMKPHAEFKLEAYNSHEWNFDDGKEHRFRLLDGDKNYLIVGDVDQVVVLTLNATETNHTDLEWKANEDAIQQCRMKGQSEDWCKNYVRILAIKSRGDLKTEVLICGTHAFQPQCRNMGGPQNDKPWQWIDDPEEGRGLCPFRPDHNTTALFAQDKKLYVGTVLDFGGIDPVIYRRPDKNDENNYPLRTEQYDLKQLNEPHFVSSLEDDDYVYFFFRERACEVSQCGKDVMHSRVGRVWKKDKGGPRSHSRRWTSFSKATLDCEIPGDSPFQFTEIQSTTRRIRKNGKDMVYAVFATNRNSLAASAICAYSFDDIRKAFNGPFMGKYSPKSEWIKVSDYEVPDPRPGSTLVNDSTLLSEYAVNFIKLYPFMYDHVQPIYQEPIFVLSQDENNARLSRIVVDENITIEDGGIRDVIFVGTDDGRVLKIVYNEDEAAEKVNAVVVEELEVFGNAKRVVNMYRYREEGEPAKIVVIGDEQIKALPVHRCDLVKSCSDCVKLQDPYCAWDTIDNHCAKVGNGSNENKPFRYVQDVRSGKNLRCPEIMSHLGNAGESKGMILNAISEDSEPARRPQRNATIVGSRLPSHSESDGLLTSQKNELFSAGPMAATEGSLDENGKILITAVVCSVVFLMAGFLAGFQFNRQCRTAPDSYPALEKWPSPISLKGDKDLTSSASGKTVQDKPPPLCKEDGTLTPAVPQKSKQCYV